MILINFWLQDLFKERIRLNKYLLMYFKDTTKCFRVSAKLKGSLKSL